MQMKTKIALVLVFLLTACVAPATTTPVTPSPIPSPTPTLPPLVLTPTSQATGTLISLTQSGSSTSKPFTVTGKAFLRVNWRQASTGKFTLIIQNTDPAQAGTPYGEVTFDSVTGPDARFMDYPFIPGQYIVKVDSDGPWTVWVETISAGPVPVP
jgi:hypothetical protein